MSPRPRIRTGPSCRNSGTSEPRVAPRARRSASGRATDRLLEVLRSDSPAIDAIGAALGNDFEAAVLPAVPEVAEAHHAVADAGAVRALLCGSGSCVFGLARDAAHADQLTRALGGDGRFGWVSMAYPFMDYSFEGPSRRREPTG